MAANEVGRKAVFTDTKIAERQEPQWFIPKLKGKKVIVRLASGGQPVTGIIEGYNPNEILLQMAKDSSLSSSMLSLYRDSGRTEKIPGRFRGRRMPNISLQSQPVAQDTCWLKFWQPKTRRKLRLEGDFSK